jgi:hypothetical protein
MTRSKRGRGDADSGAAAHSEVDEGTAGSALPEIASTTNDNAVLTPAASAQKATKRARVEVDEAAWSAALKLAENGARSPSASTHSLPFASSSSCPSSSLTLPKPIAHACMWREPLLDQGNPSATTARSLPRAHTTLSIVRPMHPPFLKTLLFPRVGVHVLRQVTPLASVNFLATC